MKGYNNSGLPFVDLEASGILVFRDLESFKDRMILGAAQSYNFFMTGKIGGTESVWKPNGVELVSLYRLILADRTHEEHHKVTSLGFVRGCEYLKMKYPTIYIGSSFSISNTKDGGYEHKNKAKYCVDRPGSANFKFLKDEIQSLNVFEEFGRIVLFKNDHHSYTPIHYDWAHQDEFVWIPLSRKSFFVFDEALEKKYHVTGSACTFNNSDYHGSDSSPFCSLSLRVDGVFTPGVRSRLAELTEAFRLLPQ